MLGSGRGWDLYDLVRLGAPQANLGIAGVGLEHPTPNRFEGCHRLISGDLMWSKGSRRMRG